MAIFSKETFTKGEAIQWPVPNYWDFAAFILIFAILILFAWGAKQMATPYRLGEAIPLSLNPAYLPYYALRTVLRMFIALVCSLLFTFTFATLAAKNKRLERIIIPAIDILQSVPVLSFLTITVVGFIALFPNSTLGPECAAIFAIFVSQAWNIALSLYQSLRTVPPDLIEAATMLRLSPWQIFWRVEVPFAMPGLLWNIMMSMSASWFFVVASEAFSVSNQWITLPGIGSYIWLAIRHADLHAIGYAIVAMLLVILLYDQLLFRPLALWSERFKFESEGEEEERTSWVIQLFQRTRFLKNFSEVFVNLWDRFVNLPLFAAAPQSGGPSSHSFWQRWSSVFWNVILAAILLLAMGLFVHFVYSEFTWREVLHVMFLGAVTGIRVVVLIILSALVWVPVGVWIGLRPRVAGIAQPLIQFLASFPAYLLFPLVTWVIVTYHLNVQVWVSPLMILGTQWYILFNVIAGTVAMPKDLRQAASVLNVRGWLWWKRLILPGIFPYIITGAITAAGGAWNASIIAELVHWGNITLKATGLGAYITMSSDAGDFSRVILGTVMMCLYVLVINRLVWRPLYNRAQERYQLS